jgi:hypothetical protein
MLLVKEELPDWFEYPKELLLIIDQNLLNFDPWIILSGDQARTRLDGLKKRYSQRELIPFAKREDNDDVACFEKERGIVIIHDFASPGYERGEDTYKFWDWFRMAVEDMIEHNMGNY